MNTNEQTPVKTNEPNELSNQFPLIQNALFSLSSCGKAVARHTQPLSPCAVNPFYPPPSTATTLVVVVAGCIAHRQCQSGMSGGGFEGGLACKAVWHNDYASPTPPPSPHFMHYTWMRVRVINHSALVIAVGRWALARTFMCASGQPPTHVQLGNVRNQVRTVAKAQCPNAQCIAVGGAEIMWPDGRQSRGKKRSGVG